MYGRCWKQIYRQWLVGQENIYTTQSRGEELTHFLNNYSVLRSFTKKTHLVHLSMKQNIRFWIPPTPTKNLLIYFLQNSFRKMKISYKKCSFESCLSNSHFYTFTLYCLCFSICRYLNPNCLVSKKNRDILWQCNAINYIVHITKFW